MTILIYFNQPIQPLQGGVQQVSSLLSTLWHEQGHKVHHLCKQDLPHPSQGAKVENRTYIHDYVKENQIELIIQQGIDMDDIYLFHRKSLPAGVKIIRCQHASLVPPLLYYREFHWLRWGALRPMIESIVFHALLPVFFIHERHKLHQRNQYICQESDAIVFLHPCYEAQFRDVLPKESYPYLCSIPNLNPHQGLPQDWSKKENEILFVGRLTFETKRVDRLLEIWNQVSTQYPEWKLSIVGDGPEYERIKTKIDQKSQIFLYGSQNPIPFYQRAKYILLTSTLEGNPMVLQEARCYGVVPIMFNSFLAASQLIADQKDGFLIPPFDLSVFVETLCDTLSYSHEQWQAMAHASYLKAQAYPVNRIKEDWQSLLNIHHAKIMNVYGTIN